MAPPQGPHGLPLKPCEPLYIGKQGEVALLPAPPGSPS